MSNIFQEDFALSTTVSWTGESDPHNFVYNFMSTIVATAVYSVGVIYAAASRELLNNADAHAGTAGVRSFLRDSMDTKDGVKDEKNTFASSQDIEAFVALSRVMAA